MAHPRTLAEWEALTGDEALSEAEDYLIECCREGKLCVLGDGTRPDKPSLERNIRAELLRWLILGGADDCPVHSRGVQLRGAYTEDLLSFDYETALGEFLMENSFLQNSISAMQSQFEQVSLKGTRVSSLNLQGAKIIGNLFLRDGFHAEGEVRLCVAKVGGQICCDKGTFENPNGCAIDADGAEVGDSILFSKGFSAKGEVRLMGAKIAQQLNCEAGRFRNDKIYAINAQRMHVSAGFIWRDTVVENGRVDLTSAHVGDLVDDLQSWPAQNQVLLDGFTYDKIAGAETPKDAKRRLDWLARGDIWEETFFPQPYTQLAKVLREMGHDRDARLVLIEKEKKLAAAQIKQDRDRAKELWYAKDQTIRGDIGWHWLRRTGFRLWNGISRRFVGYGYAPQYAFYWTVCILSVMTMFYFVLWKAGGMVPNTPVVLNSEAWAEALTINPTAPGPVWAAGDVGRHYETFYAFFYAADVFIPLIDFGQESAWTGTTENWAGWMAFFFGFFFKTFGWFITALGAAAITGIIRRD